MNINETETYNNWTRKAGSQIWVNHITKQESCFHPQALELGGLLYHKASKWCHKAASDRNERTKGKETA